MIVIVVLISLPSLVVATGLKMTLVFRNYFKIIFVNFQEIV